MALLSKRGFIILQTKNDTFTIPKREYPEPTKLKSIPGLLGTPRQYQLDGVSFIASRGGRALLADQMGVGKSCQAIAYTQLFRDLSFPVLVVCPASLKINWMREYKKWTDIKNIQILDGITPYEITGDVVIINYDILSRKDAVDTWDRALLDYDFQTIILDEAHIS